VAGHVLEGVGHTSSTDSAASYLTLRFRHPDTGELRVVRVTVHKDPDDGESVTSIARLG
jgi:hypothetical protein